MKCLWLVALFLGLSSLASAQICLVYPGSTGAIPTVQITAHPRAGQDVGYFVGSFPSGSGDWVLFVTSRTRWQYRPFNADSDLCVGPIFTRRGLRQVPNATGAFTGFFPSNGILPGEKIFIQMWYTDWAVPPGFRVNFSRVLTRTFI